MHDFPRRRFLATAVALATVALAGPGAAQLPSVQTFDKSALEIRAAAGSHRFTVELAQTSEQQTQGLMFRRRMAADAGMLFVYAEPTTARFWMKNTYIPLDMLFIAADGRIVGLAERTVPLSLETVSSEVPVIAVLELNGGTASRLKIRVGDRVIHPALGTGG
jgi:uncharacterized membrane protein (UPF0127 family)